MAPDGQSSVRVAVRIRPQSAKEKIDACRVCTYVLPGEPQVSIGKDKSFTYDHVFDIPTQQNEIFRTCIKDLVEGCFDGYNATVLAYGQTGSGKTYTMGTGFDVSKTEVELGVIPRAVDLLFGGINKRTNDAREQGLPLPEFVISAQFMELYNEEVIDLFDTSRGPKSSKIQIHEDANGNIYAVGVTTREVKSADEMMKCLQDGALNRTTASTQMNAQSSRSHAIFTIHFKQTRAIRMNAESPTSDEGIGKESSDNEVGVPSSGPLEFETLTAKFHFTDLAGSERLKRTGATGDRAKEGIAINCGLLALGNVISALGDPAKSSSHVPYRDSKLTRLLQDSLGGNSRTLMVACVSPSDSDFMETINTLKYANRARNIKNKISVNQDKSSQQIQALRAQIAALQMENMEYKTGKRVPGEECFNDMYQESHLLREENDHLRMRIKAMQENIDSLTSRLTRITAQQVCNKGETGEEEESGLESIVENYIKEIESLRSKVVESEAMCANLRRRSGSLSAAPMSPFASRVTPTPMPMSGTSVFESTSFSEIPILDLAKKDVEKLIHRKEEIETQAIIKKENKENIVTSSDDTSAADHPDNDADESSDSEEETELNLSDSEDEESEAMQKELVTLACEIDIKQKMIDEFEAQERRMNSLRHQYESKVRLLEAKIRTTEEERDKVLKNIEGKSGGGDTSKVRADYQKKLENMKKEVGKLKEAKKGHDRLLREQNKHQQQLRKLKMELEQMKTTKVRLMKQMREQQKKGKVQDSQRLREITQLKRDSRKKESQLRTLESRFQAKDRMVQRKKEELEMLRRQLKPISGKLGKRKQQQQLLSSESAPDMNSIGNVRNARDGKRPRKRTSEYSSRTAKMKWQKVEKKINDVVIQRETISQMERQMNRLIKERERIQRSIMRCEKRKSKAKASGEKVSSDLRSELEGLRDHFEYVNEQIDEIQSEILQVEESMGSDSYISTIIDTCVVNEARYLLEHLLTMVINKAALALEHQNRIKDLESRLEGEVETSKQAQELMRYMLEEQSQLDPQMTEILRGADSDDDSDSDSSPERPPTAKSVNGLSTIEPRIETKVKSRRKTSTPQELLHGIVQSAKPQVERVINPLPSPVLEAEEEFRTNGGLNSTYVVDTSTPTTSSSDFQSFRPPGEVIFSQPATPEFNTPSTPPSASTNRNIPPNVFSRLTRYALASPRTDKGRMNSYVSKTPTPRTAPLVCVQVAEGHHKPVLCVQATEHLLFSGSKDRTVKIWNLVTCQEIMSLDGHPNNVNVVRHCPNSGLVYTVSLCYIKVWDIRSRAKCVRVISSSGQLPSVSSFVGSMGRTNRMPDGEGQINDIALSNQSTALYSAAGTSVKIWDLRKFSAIGKLTGHTGQIMTMSIPALTNETVITGAKDHYVKAYDLTDASGNISPTTTLEPPHMDGVEALATSSVHNALFSGSRDKSIKKWELKSKNLLKSEYQAHQNWVCALDIINSGSEDMLISGGRGGMLKIWDVESLSLVGDIRAHSETINYIASNKNFVFTASSDSTIKVWKFR